MTGKLHHCAFIWSVFYCYLSFLRTW